MCLPEGEGRKRRGVPPTLQGCIGPQRVSGDAPPPLTVSRACVRLSVQARGWEGRGGGRSSWAVPPDSAISTLQASWHAGGKGGAHAGWPTLLSRQRIPIRIPILTKLAPRRVARAARPPGNGRRPPPLLTVKERGVYVGQAPRGRFGLSPRPATPPHPPTSNRPTAEPDHQCALPLPLCPALSSTPPTPLPPPPSWTAVAATPLVRCARCLGVVCACGWHIRLHCALLTRGVNHPCPCAASISTFLFRNVCPRQGSGGGGGRCDGGRDGGDGGSSDPNGGCCPAGKRLLVTQATGPVGATSRLES